MLIIHIYSNKIFISLTLWTVTMRLRWERKWEKESEGREKENKKITYMVNSNCVYMHGYCSVTRSLCIFRHFYKNWCESFWIKICKIKHFLYFKKLSGSWWDCSKYTIIIQNQLYTKLFIHIYKERKRGLHSMLFMWWCHLTTQKTINRKCTHYDLKFVEDSQTTV